MTLTASGERQRRYRREAQDRPLVVLPYPAFVDHVEFGLVDECWLWTGSLNKGGYGHLTVDYKTISAHRFAYMLWVGPIPDGLVIDHLCFVRHCMNPRHLEAVTPLENQLRMDDRYGSGRPECRRCGANDWYRKRTQAGRQCRPCVSRWRRERTRRSPRSTR